MVHTDGLQGSVLMAEREEVPGWEHLRSAGVEPAYRLGLSLRFEKKLVTRLASLDLVGQWQDIKSLQHRYRMV